MSASGPAVVFTGLQVHMFGWVCPSGIPALEWPPWVPSRQLLFCPEETAWGRSEAHQGKGRIGTFLVWVGLVGKETKTAVGGGEPLGV